MRDAIPQAIRLQDYLPPAFLISKVALDVDIQEGAATVHATLKLARNAPILPQTRVDISVYRTGYYGGEGGRLIPGAGATNVPVNNNFTCNAPNATTGELSCANWGVTYTIPGSALPASGVYVAKLRTTDTNVENRVVFVVRDDNRVPESRALLVLPTATYLAYNTWGGKSLYRDKNGGAATVSGNDRAVKVSFDRPLDQNDMDRDRYFGPDFFTVQWLERQGYDVSYTDDVQAHLNPAELLEHKPNPYLGDVYERLGTLLEEEGRTAEALQMLKRAYGTRQRIEAN